MRRVEETPLGEAEVNESREARAAAVARVVAAVLLVLVTVTMVLKFRAGDFKDAEVWYDAGRRVLTGETLTQLPHYRYPPTFAVLVAPLCALPFAAFFFLWYGLNVALLAVSARLAVRLAIPEGVAVEPRYYWLPSLLVAVFAVDNWFLGQTNILIMALMYWTFLESSRGREWLGGLPLGAAIAIKAFPAPVLAYFLFRGRVRLVAATVLSCGFFLLLVPGPARGFGRNLVEVRDWGDRVVMPYLSRGEAGDWGQHSLDFGNQSLPAVARRYLTQVDAYVAARERGTPMYVNFVDLRESQVNAVVLGLFAALAAAFVAACGWRRPRSPEAQAVEYSLVLTMLLMVSAISWTYFFVVLLLPITVALRLLKVPGRLGGFSSTALRVSLWGLVLATVLLANHYARAMGSLFWATVVMFAALAIAGRDLRRRQPMEQPRTEASVPS